ncbi:hypothetical protein M378DRAFT_91249, partial [Amanita muscaria Koide BX008]
RIMALGLGVFTSGAGVAVVMDHGPHIRPEIFLLGQRECRVLTEMSGERVIVFVLEYT